MFVDGPTSGASFESSIFMLEMTKTFIVFDPSISFSDLAMLIFVISSIFEYCEDNCGMDDSWELETFSKCASIEGYLMYDSTPFKVSA